MVVAGLDVVGWQYQSPRCISGQPLSGAADRSWIKPHSGQIVAPAAITMTIAVAPVAATIKGSVEYRLAVHGSRYHASC